MEDEAGMATEPGAEPVRFIDLIAFGRGSSEKKDRPFGLLYLIRTKNGANCIGSKKTTIRSFAFERLVKALRTCDGIRRALASGGNWEEPSGESRFKPRD